MSVLEIRNLNLTLSGKTIIDDLSLDFWEGHIHAVVGPNGAGKSSLANTIMGIPGYRNIGGDILFEGESINHLDVDERAHKGITLSWQEPARFEGLKVRDFLRASAKDKSDARIEQVLDESGLSTQYLDRAVDKTLSGGERKKVELASLLAMEPRIVLLDEPDSGIDVESLDRIFDALKFFKQAKATVIMITHSPTVLEHAEHGFLICHGKLLCKGSIEKMQQFFTNRCVPCDHINKPVPSELEEIGEIEK